MIRFLTITLLLCLICGGLASAQTAVSDVEVWTKQNVSTLAWLHRVYFLNAKQGWIAGSNGTLLTTIDGGDNWKISKRPTDDNLRDVYFSDSNNGFLVCERPFFQVKSSSDSRSYVLKTNDGGRSWEKASFSDNVNVQITRFIVAPDKQSKWVVGEIGSLFASKTDSASWEKQVSPTKFVLTDGILFDADNGFVIGAAATALTTSDAGKTWREALLSDSMKTRFNSISFANRQDGWIVGANGKIYATRNGGNVWKSQISNTSADLQDVFCVSPKESWIAGDDGIILKTKDGGANWTQEKSPTNHKLESIIFNEGGDGWAVGFGGAILRYKRKPMKYTSYTKVSSINQKYIAPRVIINDESSAKSVKFVKVLERKSKHRRLTPNPRVKI